MAQAFEDIKNEISKGIAGCTQTDETVHDIVHYVRTLVEPRSNEPGVHLIDSLQNIIQKTIGEAVNQHCNLSPITRGIIIGSFRSNRSVRSEAHRTIDHLIEHILTATVSSNGNLKESLTGIMEGLALTAKEQELNVEEALKEAREDLLFSAKKLHPELEAMVREVLAQLPTSY